MSTEGVNAKRSSLLVFDQSSSLTTSTEEQKSNISRELIDLKRMHTRSNSYTGSFTGSIAGINRLKTVKPKIDAIASIRSLKRKSSEGDSHQSSLLHKSFMGFITKLGGGMRGLGWKVRLSVHYGSTLPLGIVVVASGLVVIGLSALPAVVFSSIWWYNFLLKGVCRLADVMMLFVTFALVENIRRRVAWELLWGRATMDDVIKASEGSLLVRGGATVMACGVASFIAMYVMAFTASWTPIPSPLGSGQCFQVATDASMSSSFSLQETYVQGLLDNAPVNRYGIPLADGIVVGRSPTPGIEPSGQFSITGSGLAVVIQVDCELMPAPEYALPTPPDASGLFLQSLHVISGGVLAEIDVINPSKGYGLPIPTPAAKQSCRARLIWGSGNWTTEYVVDEWGQFGNDQVMSFQYAQNHTVTRSTSDALFSDHIISHFQSASTIHPLLPFAADLIRNITSNVWYNALLTSGAQSGSSFMRWAHPANLQYYDPKHTWKSLAGTLAAAIYGLIKAQTVAPALCDYSSKNGNGIIGVDSKAALASQILTILTGCLLLVNVLRSHLSLPIKDRAAFKQALLDMFSEWRRLAHISSLAQSILLTEHVSGALPTDIANAFSYHQVRFGYGIESGEMTLGAVEDVTPLESKKEN
jgi:hypothetical protein